MPTEPDTTDTTPTVEPETTTTEPPQPDTGLNEGGKRALEAERKARSEAEKAARAATAELEKLRKSAMSDQEKAIDAARTAARAELMAEVGAERVENAVRAATAGRNVDADALLDGLDRARFLTDDGKPDTQKITEWVDRIAPKGQTAKPAAKDIGQGARPGATGAPQILDRSELKGMTPAEIDKAHREGRLDRLMGIAK
jgi:hypothetical protein